MEFVSEQNDRVTQIEQIIKAYLPEEEGYAKTVIEAMNYSVLAGGKRLRPMLMNETYRLFGCNGKEIEPFIIANNKDEFMASDWHYQHSQSDCTFSYNIPLPMFQTYFL